MDAVIGLQSHSPSDESGAGRTEGKGSPGLPGDVERETTAGSDRKQVQCES